jgi:hypothetical protein
VPDKTLADLSLQWGQTWARCLPYAPVLKTSYPDRWVRFHSLPGSKRYPDDEAEHTIVLDRYNTVLDDLFAGQEVYVISTDWNDQLEPAQRPADHDRWHSGSRHWTSICVNSDSGFEAYWHLYVSRIQWQRGCVNELLRAVANDEAPGVMLTDLTVQRVHHPYDGGADVLLAPNGERDQLRSQHANWLPDHPSGH